MTRSPLPVWGYLVLTFVTGLGVGIFGHSLYQTQTASAAAPVKKSHEEFRKQYMSEMQTRLNLSTDQMQKLAGIMDQTKAEHKAFRERTGPEVKAIQERHCNNVRAMLSPEQKVAYEKLIQERELKKKMKQ